MSIKDERLEKRHWLLYNFQHVFNQGIYYRTHKDNFRLPKQLLWNLSESEGTVILDETT